MTATMSHRRVFLKQLAAGAGLVSLARLQAIDAAFARTSLSQHGPIEYMLDPSVVYLNHASIGTIPRLVHEAHGAYLETCEANPWLYMWGGAWEEPREVVRAKAARLLRCDPDEIALTHNTTEGFNTLAQGLPLGPGDEVLFSSLNHPGASLCWHHVADRAGFRVRQFDVPFERIPDLTADELLDLHDREIQPATRVLVFPHIDNMVGVRHPLRALATLAHTRGVEFVAVDGAQSVGMIPVELAGSSVDFYAASPHKWLQAPKGLGLLYVRREVQESLRPMWVTWGQERWAGSARVFEDYGTRNLPALLALGDAIDVQDSLGEAEKLHGYERLWNLLKTTVENTSRVEWRSPTGWELSGSLCALEVSGIESTELFERLNTQGFVFRPFRTETFNTARISPNLATTDEEILRFFATVSS
jgi:selenocysteine lyase/cysteine desulfurase